MKIKYIWLAAVTGILATTLFYYDHRVNSDVAVFEVWTMLALTFPLGWTWMFFSSLLKLFGLYSPFHVATSYFSLSLIWVGFFMTGLFQWFVVVPFIRDMDKKKRGSPRRDSQ